MRTIEEIEGRCRIEIDGKGKIHWIWAGGYDERAKGDAIYRTPVLRAPDYTKDPTGVSTPVQFGARAVWHIVHKKAVPKGKRIYRICTFEGCMHPGCVKAMTPSKWGEMVRVAKRYQNLPGWSAKAVRAWDKRGRRIADETVVAAVLTPGTAKDVAAQLGIDASTVARYRRGDYRKRAVQQTMGPFSGLML